MSKKRKSGPFADLGPTATGAAHELCVIVDTPRGSRAKYRYDEDRRLFRLTEVLPAVAFFPFNTGCVLPTRGEDGGGLDVKISERVAFRALQVDYVTIFQASSSNGGRRDNLRVSTGLVFSF